MASLFLWKLFNPRDNIVGKLDYSVKLFELEI